MRAAAEQVWGEPDARRSHRRRRRHRQGRPAPRAPPDRGRRRAWSSPTCTSRRSTRVRDEFPQVQAVVGHRRAGRLTARRLRALRPRRRADRRGRRRAQREDRLRRRQQPARPPGRREAARGARHPLRARLLRELRRPDPGRRRARRLLVRARAAARQRHLRHHPLGLRARRAPTACRRRSPPTGSPNAGCATWVACAGSGCPDDRTGQTGWRDTSHRRSTPASVRGQSREGSMTSDHFSRTSGSTCSSLLATVTVQLTGERPEVRLVSAVLQVASDLRLLGFSSAAPHRVSPLANRPGQRRHPGCP